MKTKQGVEVYILNLDTSVKGMISFALVQLYLLDNPPFTHQIGRWLEPRTRVATALNKKI
jgi:hypothetical protein